MNNDSTRKRRVQKTLGLHYSRFYLIARCIDSLFRRKILENRSSAAPVEKVGLSALFGSAMAQDASAPPSGTQKLFEFRADGVQIYVCKPKDETQKEQDFAWV